MIRKDYGRSILITGALLVTIVTALLWSSRRVQTPQSATVSAPENLTIARASSGGTADALYYDGADWQTLVPSTTLASETFSGTVYSPRIVSIIPRSDFSKVAMLVNSCAITTAEFDSCTSKGYIYDVVGESLDSIDDQGGDTLAPIAWLGNGNLLVQAVLNGNGWVYDVTNQTTTIVPAPDDKYSLPVFPEGLSPNGELVAYSGRIAEKVLPLTPGTGAATVIPGTPSPYNTGSMVFNPSGTLIALVRLRGNEDNVSGGGSLQIATVGGFSQPIIVTSSTNVMDFSPVWVDGGDGLAFLRGNATAWRSAPTSQDDPMPATLMFYDVSLATTSTILGSGVVRTDLVAPEAGSVVATREYDQGLMHVRVVDVSTGDSDWAIASDPDEHTAIGAPRQ